MKNEIKSLSLLIAGVLFCMFMVSCSDSGQATVQLSLNLPRNISSLNKSSDGLIDRFLRIFSTAAYAQEAPAGITSVTVKVSGPDMETFEQNYPADTVLVSLAVEAGKGRIFEVTVAMDPANPSAALSFQGSATTDLLAGEKKTLELDMAVRDFKLAVPDMYMGRLVIMQSMNAPQDEWLVITDVHLDGNTGEPSSVSPQYVDVDSRGNVYIADQNLLRIYKIESLTGPNAQATTVVSLMGYGSCTGMAIDRENNTLYYVDSANSTDYALKKNLADGTDPVGIDASYNLRNYSNSMITGMCMGADGYLLLTSIVDGNAGKVFKYDQNAGIVVGYDPDVPAEVYADINNGEPYDVMSRDQNTYVAVYDITATSNRIIRYDLGLENPDERFAEPNNPDNGFYGPKRFIESAPERITVIDEGPAADNRLVSFDEIEDPEWETAGETYFFFFNQF